MEKVSVQGWGYGLVNPVSFGRLSNIDHAVSSMFVVFSFFFCWNEDFIM